MCHEFPSREKNDMCSKAEKTQHVLRESFPYEFVVVTLNISSLFPVEVCSAIDQIQPLIFPPSSEKDSVQGEHTRQATYHGPGSQSHIRNNGQSWFTLQPLVESCGHKIQSVGHNVSYELGLHDGTKNTKLVIAERGMRTGGALNGNTSALTTISSAP